MKSKMKPSMTLYNLYRKHYISFYKWYTFYFDYLFTFSEICYN